MLDAPRHLYYALGGGLGHGMRALALARRLAPLVGGRHRILINSPFARTLAAVERPASIELAPIEPTATPAEAGRRMQAELQAFQPRLLVVDTFPRGLGGELADRLPDWRAGLRTLVGRRLPARYVEAFELEAFVSTAYDLIFAPGEPTPYRRSDSVRETGPWLVRRVDELPAPSFAAERLGLTDGRRCTLVVGSGTTDECREWCAWFRELSPVWPESFPPLRLALPIELPAPPDVDPRRLVRHAPLVELLPAAALVIGAAGYHLFHETRRLRRPALWIARPRRYDDQRARVESSGQTAWTALDDPAFLARLAERAGEIAAGVGVSDSPSFDACGGGDELVDPIDGADWAARQIADRLAT